MLPVGTILKSLGKRIGGPVLIYITIAAFLGMGGTFIYVKYLKDKNLNLLQAVAGLNGALSSSEDENTMLRSELEYLDYMLTQQRLGYDVINKKVDLKIGEISNEEDVNDYINRSEFNRLQQW